MSGNFYSDYLYPLQDKVLNEIDKVGTPFYLTGGTATSRCYLHHRYSDDLDFFQNQSDSFHQDANIIMDYLKNRFIVRPAIRDDSFFRMFVKEKEQDAELKIELINDVGYHNGTYLNHALFSKVDSWINILSNKLTALSRQASKDIADIVLLSCYFHFNWEEVISDAKRKDAWINEIIISQTLHDFDVMKLKEVQWIKPEFLDFNFSPMLKIIAKESLHGFDNSLTGKLMI